jgi:hypothetical protein
MSVGCGACWLGPATMRLAEAVPPFPASFDVTALVVLFCVPEVVPVTFTANMQAAPAARVVVERLTLLDPAAAVMVPPPQFPVSPLGVAMICPAGSVSVKPTPLRDELLLGFERLKVSDVVPFNATLAAPNVLLIVGGSFAGGGGELLDEPPPHATFAAKPTMRLAVNKSGAECDAKRNPPIMDGPLRAGPD